MRKKLFLFVINLQYLLPQFPSNSNVLSTLVLSHTNLILPDLPRLIFSEKILIIALQFSLPIEPAAPVIRIVFPLVEFDIFIHTQRNFFSSQYVFNLNFLDLLDIYLSIYPFLYGRYIKDCYIII